MKYTYEIWTVNENNTPYIFDIVNTQQECGDLLGLSINQIRERIYWNVNESFNFWHVYKGFKYQIKKIPILKYESTKNI